MSLVVRQEWKGSGVIHCFDLLAYLASAQAQPLRAAHLYRASKKLQDAIGMKQLPVYSATYERYLIAARAQVTSAAWDEAWTAGQAMSLEEAIAFALKG
jgi:hypothetical protein